MARRRGRGNAGTATPGTRRKVAQARTLAPKHTSLESLAKAVGSSASTLSKHGVSAQGGMTDVGRMHDNKRGSPGLTLDEPGAPIYDAYERTEPEFNDLGWHRNGTRFDDDGYNDAGFNPEGWRRDGEHRNGTKYDAAGWDINGRGPDGRDINGYDAEGYDKDGFDSAGHNPDGFDRDGDHRNGTRFDDDGHDQFGFTTSGDHRNGTRFDDDGHNHKGYNRRGEHRSERDPQESPPRSKQRSPWAYRNLFAI